MIFKTLFCLSLAFFLSVFFIYIFPIGHLSDDFVVLQRALGGERLWTIHYSWFLEIVWKADLSTKIFKLLSLAIHLLNSLLFYRLLKSYFNIEQKAALLTTTLFLFSAAGLEALAWNCCLGYLITATFLFLALNIIEMFIKKHTLTLSVFLAIIQFLAVMTWDWGVLVLPMSFAALLFSEKRPSLKQIALFLGPAAIVLIAYLIFRSTLGLEAVYGRNTFTNMAKFFLGSPLLILLPNMEKPFFASSLGMFLTLSLAAYLIYLFVKEKTLRVTLVFFTLALLPWIIGGYPSSRYYYLSAPFLFVIFARKKPLLLMLLAIQAVFFFERAELWNVADAKSKSIALAIKEASQTVPPGKEFVVINTPDAFGPQSFPMRPQSWHCGIETVCQSIKEVKIRGIPFVWDEGSTFMTREEIKERFSNEALFEVVLNGDSFELISFL